MTSLKSTRKKVFTIILAVVAIPLAIFLFAFARYAVKCGPARASCLEHMKAGCGINGTYELKSKNLSVDATCDMKSDSGGWTLVANYLHRAGPKAKDLMVARADRLPLQGSLELGNNEVGTRHWGHAGTPLLGEIPFKEVRFKCRATAHDRKIDFVISSERCLNYFRTGKGTCLGTPELREELTRGTRIVYGHNGFMPANAQKGWIDQGDNSIVSYPFFADWKSHFSPGAADNRWECDDVDAGAKGGGSSTLHQVWVR